MDADKKPQAIFEGRSDEPEGLPESTPHTHDGINSPKLNVPYKSSGTAAPTSTPEAIGDIYVDTVNAKIYIATGVISSSDWTIVN